MRNKNTINTKDFTDISDAPRKGRMIALDLGKKRVGVAVCDEFQITTRRLETIKRKSWKKLLKEVIAYFEEFNAKALVIGLPYNFDGTESVMSGEARNLALNFSLSLDIPVYLQDERTTTYEARSNLWKRGLNNNEISKILDSEAAAIILSDFIELRKSLAKKLSE